MTTLGVDFPLRNGRRSATGTSREVFAQAARVVDADLAHRIDSEPNWRKNYLGHLRALVEAEARSPEAALQVAHAGLAAIRERFVVVTDGGELTLAAAAAVPAQAPGTVEVRGSGQRTPELVVPYRGQQLRGDPLRRQLEDWVRRGITEPSFAEAVNLVVSQPDWLDLSDRTFALLGAGAELAPLGQLLSWNARVAAVDLPDQAIWERILTLQATTPGTLLVPVHRSGSGSTAGTTEPGALEERAGLDLLTGVPELQQWLTELPGPLTVANYGYADAAGFVRLAVAADTVFAEIAGRRPDLSLSYLATPTDVFVVPADAVRESRARYASRAPSRVALRAVRLVSGGRLFAPNYSGLLDTAAGPVGIADALVPQQGPNYALAKRLQRWRAVVTRADGLVTSAYIAPPTVTRSVLKNRLLAAAYAGAGPFGVEVFQPATTRALVAAVLVHDLRNPASLAQPGVHLDHPHRLFEHAANHAGLWRQPYAPRTSLPVAAVLGLLRRPASALPHRGP